MNAEVVVSVITIAWRDRDGLSKTVDSVRKQTWPAVEHIIVDGGSDDGTGDYLAALDPQPVWVSEKDNGRYDAMNKGISLSTGDLLIFMNSADVFHDSRSVEILAKKYLDEDFGWAFGLSNVVNGGRTVSIVGRIPFSHARFLLGGNVIPHQAAVFSRSLLQEIGGYDTDFGLTADQELMVRASMVQEPSTVADVVCDFDATGAGSTRGARAHYRDMVRARRKNGIVVTGSGAIDYTLSAALCGVTIVQRRVRSTLRRMRPRGRK